MKTQLILLENYNIIVSDEEIKEDDSIYEEISGIFSPYEKGDIVQNPKKIIAGLPELPSIDYNGLEEKYGIVDVRELCNNDYIKYYSGESISTIDYVNGYLQGFKTAQSLNDKKFSLEDVNKVIKMAREGFTCIGGSSTDTVDDGEADDCVDWSHTENDIIKSLQQPKNWLVEVEMEAINDHGELYSFDDMEFGVEKKYQPKITNNKIKILK